MPRFLFFQAGDRERSAGRRAGGLGEESGRVTWPEGHRSEGQYRDDAGEAEDRGAAEERRAESETQGLPARGSRRGLQD